MQSAEARYVLQANGLTKQLGGQPLFSNIYLTVCEGESLAILGESGSGKSTLLHILAGLDTADTGQVLIQNQCLGDLPANALNPFRLKHIGLVFQSYYLMPHLSVMQNVQLPFLLDARSPDMSHCQSLLDQVGLLDKASRLPKELSGGEQQRVAIARALALSPPLILADEPTGNLDERNADRVMETLLSLCDGQRCALVMVTHSHLAAAQLNRRVRLAHQTLNPMA